MITIRIGLPQSTGQIPRHVYALGQPALLSAGALWVPQAGRFRRPGRAMAGLDCALDSAGYARMVRGDGYPWSVAAYGRLAASWQWAWWAQMDYPCEAELAPGARDVERRIHASADNLRGCRAEALRLRDLNVRLADPLPVLQGRSADDYRRSVDLYGAVLGGTWPALVGVGSMCRRRVGGTTGVLAVVGALDAVLPAAVQLHLFGVKGEALVPLRNHPRVRSVDSQAWGDAARRAAYADHRLLPPEMQKGPVCTTVRKKQALDAWLAAQQRALTPSAPNPGAGEQMPLWSK